MNNNVRTDNYSIMKFIAAILVVFAHTTRMYTGYGAISMPVNSVLKNLTELIYSFHMPLFFFLSGCVYGKCIESGKYDSYILFVRNKAKKLLIPYLIIGIFYVTPVMVLLKITKKSFPEYIIKGILLGQDSRHLWYLTTLFLIFVGFGLFRKIILQRKKAVLLILGLSFIVYFFSSIIPTEVPQYLCFFILGTAFSFFPAAEQFFSKKRINCIIWPVLFLSVYLIQHFGTPFNSLFRLVLSVFGIFSTIAISDFLSSFLTKTKIYSAFTPNLMGIYLIHPMIIYVLFYFLKQYSLAVHPYLATLLIFGISLTVSYFISDKVNRSRLSFVLGG